VRFLLAPCNQFLHQEPDPNQQISHFAEQYVDLHQGNIIMLAKLSLNGVSCSYGGADACTAASAGCCPTNDAVYSTLLTNYPLVCTKCTNPTSLSRPIGWNFNKILLGKDGRPWTLEILAGGDDDLAPWIDSMLSDGAPPAKDSVVGRLRRTRRTHRNFRPRRPDGALVAGTHDGRRRLPARGVGQAGIADEEEETKP